MRNVRWANSALDDYAAAIGFIRARNPAAARRVVQAIRVAVSGLANLLTGHPGRVTGTYERLVRGLPYIIAYALETTPEGDENVVILQVVHGARDWRPEEWPE